MIHPVSPRKNSSSPDILVYSSVSLLNKTILKQLSLTSLLVCLWSVATATKITNCRQVASDSSINLWGKGRLQPGKPPQKWRICVNSVDCTKECLLDSSPTEKIVSFVLASSPFLHSLSFPFRIFTTKSTPAPTSVVLPHHLPFLLPTLPVTSRVWHANPRHFNSGLPNSLSHPIPLLFPPYAVPITSHRIAFHCFISLYSTWTPILCSLCLLWQLLLHVDIG